MIPAKLTIKTPDTVKTVFFVSDGNKFLTGHLIIGVVGTRCIIFRQVISHQ